MRSKSYAILLGSGVAFMTMLVAGCSEKAPETLSGHAVSGKITINGKEPATYCSMEFVSSTNSSETGSAGVEPSGSYSGRVPLGKCKVALKVSGGPPSGGSGGSSNPYARGGSGYSKGGGPSGPPAGSGGPGSGSGGPPLMRGAEIPKKFQDVKTSGIEVDVIDGQALNIDFK